MVLYRQIIQHWHLFFKILFNYRMKPSKLLSNSDKVILLLVILIWSQRVWIERNFPKCIWLKIHKKNLNNFTAIFIELFWYFLLNKLLLLSITDIPIPKKNYKIRFETDALWRLIDVLQKTIFLLVFTELVIAWHAARKTCDGLW